MKLIYRLQTHDECATLAVATAIEQHLKNLGPEYMIEIDTKLLEKMGGIYKIEETLKLAQTLHPWLRWESSDLEDLRFPMVGSTWMNGYLHAVSRINDKEFYDPGLGELVTFSSEQQEKTGAWFRIYSENAPVSNKWLKYYIVKFFARLFGFID